MSALTVDLGERSYPITIGPDLLDDAGLLRQAVPARQVMIVSNETIAPLYLDKVTQGLSDKRLAVTILPDGERFKTLEQFDQIVTQLLENKFDRGACLVALGGGVVGDITGFAAASYQRGINFVQIPTTLLAQVDSSVGGKTAVNHPLGKNMIGAFHQPRAVIADTNTLKTLADRELRAGIAEVIKYGLIADAPFFEWLEENIEDLLDLAPAKLSYAIERSCQNKADVVARDEFESNVRALLNLGHTFGHAIENVYGYGNWLHGEAVACGMCLAADLSLRMGLIKTSEFERTKKLIERSGLPSGLPADVDAAALEAAMAVDKKNRNGNIRLVLMQSIGKACICDDYPRNEFRAVLGFTN